MKNKRNVLLVLAVFVLVGLVVKTLPNQGLDDEDSAGRRGSLIDKIKELWNRATKGSSFRGE